MQSKNAINILKKRDLMYLVKFIEITPLNGVVARVAESLLIKDVRPTLNTFKQTFVCFHYLVTKIWKPVCGGIFFRVILSFTLLHWNETLSQMCFAKKFTHKLYFNWQNLVFNFFYWSFKICIYCNHGNLDLLAFIVHLWISLLLL